MINAPLSHQLCRPPSGMKIVVRLVPPSGRSPGRFVREGVLRPALAFLSEDKADKTSATVWVPDCACIGNPRCPRERAFAYAARRYDTTSVMIIKPVATRQRRRR